MQTKIVIQVKEGCIFQIVSNTENVEISILDHDWEYPQLQKYVPDSIMTDEGIQEYIEKEEDAINLFLKTPDKY